LNASRKKRVASGSGVEVQEVNRLLKQHQQMQNMMKKLRKLGKKGLARQGLGSLMGGGSGNGIF
jgi:signal recognition particle subunit SRP54